MAKFTAVFTVKTITKTIGNAIKLSVYTIPLIFLSTASGAHHFLSGLATEYPQYDLTDAYVFASERPDYTAFILSANPSSPGSSAMNTEMTFGQGGLYNFHIASNDAIDQGITITFLFAGENAEVSLVDSPNAAIGTQGEHIGIIKVGETFELKNGMRGWAGRVQEPFFGNGVGLADFNAKKANGEFAPQAFDIEQPDLFSGATNSSIVLEIPNKLLGEQVKYYITTATNHKGEWTQVNREANVLMPYVFFADTPAVQEDHDQHRPDSDVLERRQALVNNIFFALSVSQAEVGNPLDYAKQTADLLMPDVLTYKPGSKAEYVVTNLNGRALADDAMNTALTLMVGKPVDDKANPSGKYQSSFPYLIPAE